MPPRNDTRGTYARRFAARRIRPPLAAAVYPKRSPCCHDAISHGRCGYCDGPAAPHRPARRAPHSVA